MTEMASDQRSATTDNRHASNMFALAGTRALVTGGSRGIGAACARLLAQAGADVAITYRSRENDAESVASDIRRLGRNGDAYRVELTDRRQVEETVGKIAGAWGGIDIFIGNAGIWPSEEAAVREMPDERWSRPAQAGARAVAALHHRDLQGALRATLR